MANATGGNRENLLFIDIVTLYNRASRVRKYRSTAACVSQRTRPEESMEYGIWIFRDDEFLEPIYADPAQEDVDEAVWVSVCEHVLEAYEGDANRFDTVEEGDFRIGWKLHSRTGVTVVVAVPTDNSVTETKQFLNDLAQRYFDEVDDARFPDVGGVADIVIDVIPPWED